jgi:hypothetical protein
LPVDRHVSHVFIAIMNVSVETEGTYTARRKSTKILRKSRGGDEHDSCDKGLHVDSGV